MEFIIFSKNFGKIFITNRTEANTTHLVEKFDLNLVKFSEWKSKLESVDIIIFSTSSKKPLLTDKDLINIDSKRNKKIILVDLSVPRNIIINNNYNNVGLVDLDKLKDKVNENYNKRISEVKKAEKLIEKYVIEYNQWLDSRELRPSIISIKKEIKNLMSDTESIGNNNREIQEIYDKFSDRLVKKILSVSENGKNTDALNIINKIFTDD